MSELDYIYILLRCLYWYKVFCWLLSILCSLMWVSGLTVLICYKVLIIQFCIFLYGVSFLTFWYSHNGGGEEFLRLVREHGHEIFALEAGINRFMLKLINFLLKWMDLIVLILERIYGYIKRIIKRILYDSIWILFKLWAWFRKFFK